MYIYIYIWKAKFEAETKKAIGIEKVKIGAEAKKTIGIEQARVQIEIEGNELNSGIFQNQQL